MLNTVVYFKVFLKVTSMKSLSKKQHRHLKSLKMKIFQNITYVYLYILCVRYYSIVFREVLEVFPSQEKG